MNASTIVLVLALLSCGGCAWIPDSGQYDTDRGTIDPAVRATFAPGTSTRADVLCQLGEPDWISSDETRFVYQIRIIDSWFFILMGVNVWGEVVSELFEFDAHGVLLSRRSVRESYSGGGDGGPNPLPPPSPAAAHALFDAPASGS